MSFSTHTQLNKKAFHGNTDRFNYLQKLVNEFQETKKYENKSQILANLGNFAYDPVNYEYFRRLNIIDLFLDMITEEDNNMILMGIQGICNCSCDYENQKVIRDIEGIPDIIQLLQHQDQTIIINALTTLYLLAQGDSNTFKEIAINESVRKRCQKFISDEYKNNSYLQNIAQILLLEIS